jgi:hypothetical protein
MRFLPEGPSPDGPGMRRCVELDRDRRHNLEHWSRFRPVRRQALRMITRPERPVWALCALAGFSGITSRLCTSRSRIGGVWYTPNYLIG